MYLCTLPHKVIRVEIVSKHTVSKTRGLRRKQCSLSLSLSAINTSLVYTVTMTVRSVHLSL